eukprot:TRINITY_DN16565_c0_g1_i1.p1 TRINITY_DN16565_c0_g1~~TRINITY_DN16565_c0_g1_i1.p1  ORF type:complete len:855 (+),score=357.16 TRINITY_DN16565_c0_g1_i1:89-2653(+)
MSVMERKQSSQAMQSASRASVTGSSVTNRSHMRSRQQGVARRVQGDKGDQPPMRVLDPDHRDTDRTPKSLLRDMPTANRSGPKKSKREGDTAGTSQSADEPSVSVSRFESSDSGSESSRMESSAESDGDESVVGMDRLALDDETSSMDSRLQDDKKKKKGEGKGGDDAGDEGLLGRMGDAGGAPEKGDGKERKKDKDQKEKEKTKMSWDERQRWQRVLETVTLSETETFFLLDRPDELHSTEAETDEVIARKTRYERYVDMCQKAKNSDKYMERGMLTFNEPHKNKETQFQPPAVARVGAGATVWEIADTMRQLEEEADAAEEVALGVGGGAEGAAEGGAEAAEEADMMDDETTMLMAEMDDDGGDEHRSDRHARRKAWMNSDRVLTTLLMVERVVVHNTWQVEQLAYRGLKLENHIETSGPEEKGGKGQGKTAGGASARDARKDRESEGDGGGDADEGASDDDDARGEVKMRTLWRFGCDRTQEKNITCMSWNRANCDLLAVGYGEYGIPGTGANKHKKHDGLVCCWSLKNPVHPERVIEIENAGVSAVGFSHDHPNLLAVGNTDGTLALYDVRKRGSTPALKSTVSSIPGAGQHTGTIWEVQWVQKGRDRGESLVSIAADGRVKQWSIKKGLECVNLLRLKRSQSDAAAGTAAAKGGEAMLSRQSGGMCFDFNPSEPIQYIVGTEDGTVHKCNTTNQETYIAPDYAGHGGEPVYRVRWSPFCHEYFLTCSADWTAKLWSEKKSQAVLNFDGVQDAVQDCAWSPSNACVFGTVTAQGRVDIYNMRESLEPAAGVVVDRRLNCMQFAQQESAVVVVGDDRGEVTVLKLSGAEYERPPDEDQAEAFLKTVRKLTA